MSLSEEPEPDKDAILRVLSESGAEILLNYLPVGSELAARSYAECALDAGLGFIKAPRAGSLDASVRHGIGRKCKQTPRG